MENLIKELFTKAWEGFRKSTGHDEVVIPDLVTAVDPRPEASAISGHQSYR